MIDRFIEWLKGKHLGQAPFPPVFVLDGLSYVQVENEVGFGAYSEAEGVIYVAHDIPNPEYNIPYTIAYEYRRYMQKMSGRGFDEGDAHDFAKQIMIEWRKVECQN